MFFSEVTPETAKNLDRDALLQLAECDLADLCRIDAFIGSGPGGQHRNRNYTAIRVTLKEIPFLTAEDAVSRSQKQNLSSALNKLRIKIAKVWRKKALENYSYCHFNAENPAYALELARLLDILCGSAFDHKIAAAKCNLSNTALLKELSRDYEVWEKFTLARAELGLNELKKPRS